MVMVFGLVACGGAEKAEEAPAAEAPAAEAPAAEAPAAEAPAEEAPKGYKIGLTNSFNGNTYRQQMEAYFTEVCEAMKADGIISEYTISEANNDANAQISHIESFILDEYDVIIVDPCSSTALNGAIQEAVDAGIPVISINDGPVEFSHELFYDMVFAGDDMMYDLTTYVCEAMGGEGSLIELRGTAGTAFDDLAHSGVVKALEKYPNVEVVAEIYTDWTGSTAQQELASVLPTLDSVDGVVTQGGDAYAAVQAFISAGMDLPIIAGDNRGYFLKWWLNDAPEGYDTLSMSANPWVGGACVYVAIDVLNGETVSNFINFPNGAVTADLLEQFADLEDEGIGTPTYDWDWVRETLY